MKLNVAVIFGGRSCEHDISIITGNQLMENADKNKYNIIPVYISRDGNWYTGAKLKDMSFYQSFDENQVRRVYLPSNAGEKCLMIYGKKGLLNKKDERIPVDVAVPSVHGMNGEDGTLQGLLEMADIPYASSGVPGSAVGMDKILMKAIFKGGDIPVLDSVSCERGRWELESDKMIAEIEQALNYPVFVKPCNLGSSIGISRANDRESLKKAVEIAFNYDRRLLVEAGLTDFFEVNCSCLGYGADVRTSVCEMPVNWEEFLTFDDKYMRGGKSEGGMQALQRKIPAPIDDGLCDLVQSLSVKIFRLLDCKGVVRIDFMFDKNKQELYCCEINTVPGSFAFYLWEPLGIKFSSLIDRIIEYALQAHKDKEENVYAFDSSILQKVVRGGSKGSKMHGKV